MFKKWGLNTTDVILFLIFAGIYVTLGVIWTLSGDNPYGPNDPTVSLQVKKDLMYAALWLTAVGFAVVANIATLWNKAPRSGLIAFPIILGVMGAVFLGLTVLTEVLKTGIEPSVKVLSIAIGDLLVLLPVVTASIVFFIALIGTAIFNHQRAQPVAQGFIRLGIAIMTFPLIQFLAIVVLPRWEDEVRGVVFIHAMGLGLMWGIFLGGALGSNLRKPTSSSDTVTA